MQAITNTSNLNLPRGATNIRVRHDAKVRVVVTCGLSMHGDPCMDEVIPIDHIEGFLTVASVTHGKVSGYDSGIRVQYTSELVEPERNLLTGRNLCDCSKCVGKE